MHISSLPLWTLDLQSLSQRGSLMIAHDGSLVHPDGEPSTAPDPTRLADLLQQASTARNLKWDLKGGLDFFDIARIHTEHVLSTAHPKLSEYHNQISLGECGLLWEILRGHPDTLDGVILTSRLQQWLGEERLPDEWWYSRPKETIGLFQARKTANEVAKLSKQIAEEAGIRKLSVHDASMWYHWNWWIVYRYIFLFYSALSSIYAHYYIAYISAANSFLQLRVKFCSEDGQ